MDYLTRRHPLQRMGSPSRGLSAALHVLGLSSFAASFKYLVGWPSPAAESWGWHFQYLTIIGLALATLTFALGLLADLTLSPRIFLLKNTLSFCTAPLEILISILYWSICAIDRTLVMPSWVVLDPWADVGFHAVPALLLAVDLLFFSPPWTIGALPAVGTSCILAFAYWVWVEACYYHNGWYPYPLFEVLDAPARAGVFAVSALVMTGSAMVLKFVYGRVNGTGVEGLRSTKAKPGAVKQ